MNNTFLKSVLRADVGKTTAQRGRHPGQLGHHFVEVSKEALLVGTATLSNARLPGETSFRRRLHKHDLLCSEEFGQVATRAP